MEESVLNSEGEGLKLVQELIQQFNIDLELLVNKRINNNDKETPKTFDFSTKHLTKLETLLKSINKELKITDKLIEKLKSEDFLFNLIKSKKTYNPTHVIHEGEYSSIYKVNLPEDRNTHYAMKIVNRNKIKSEVIANEVDALRQLSKSKYSIKLFLDGQLDENYHFMILEYIQGCNLKELVMEGFLKDIFNEKITFFFFIQIYYGICEMHYNGIVHRNLRLENILYDENKGKIVIADFKSNLLYNGKCHNEDNSQVFISKDLVCPEGLINSLKSSNIKENSKFDVYSLGVILYFLVFRHYPYKIGFSKNSDDWAIEKFSNILKKVYEEIQNSHISKELQELLKGLLEFKNDKRIKLSQIQFNPWFKENKKKMKSLMDSKTSFKDLLHKLLKTE